jgi:hypothetical protein
MPIARLFAWGPAYRDWDTTAGRWEVRWDWAWGGWRDARASSQAPVPWPTLDSTRHALGLGAGSATQWTLAPGDDAAHALLVARHTLPSPSSDLIVLESERPPLTVQRADGKPLADVESAIRASGRWYVATPESPSEPSATVVWELDGGVARERARVPRAGFENHAEARLARRSDGRALGLVVEGQPDVSRPPSLWVTGLNLETRTFDEPEPIARGAGQPIAVCTAADSGWEFDMAYPGAIDVAIGDRWTASLQSPVVHVRASRDGMCGDRILGGANPFATAAPAALWSRPGGKLPASVPAIDVGVLSARTRYGLRCAAH